MKAEIKKENACCAPANSCCPDTSGTAKVEEENEKEGACCAPVSSCCPDTRDAATMEEELRKIVRDNYAKAATRESSCCGSTDRAQKVSKKLGYSEEEMGKVPDGANLGLGCGNPTALASLKAGETVLDLGSGAGFDCFLAANKVGEDGKVIGVDMTSEMLAKARENARKAGYDNVEFRLGEIENLPLADNSVDVVISNCVINLVPNKRRVFAETFRVLKPSGRLMISDIVLLRELPESIKNSDQAYVSCIAGAVMKDEYLGGVKLAGFQDIEVMKESSFSLDCADNDPIVEAVAEKTGLASEEIEEAADSMASIMVYGVKPANI